MRIAVVGAGIGGLWAALTLSRRGHDVLLLERAGAAQSLQPHLFLSGAYAEIMREAPDLLTQLLAAGAYLHDQTTAFPGGLAPREEDWQLRVICCRRLVFEDVLRETVRRERRVEIRSGVSVRGLEARAGNPLTVTGVVTDRGPIRADATVLADGRGTRVRHWLAEHRVDVAELPSVPSGLTHYSRHYRLPRDAGIDLSRWPLGGPHGECAGYSFHLFIGDKDTFSLLQAIRRDDQELRILRDADAFTSAARSVPIVRPFLDAATPLTPVLPFGGLVNTFRDFTRDGRPVVHGLFVIGDALSTTNSFYGYGVTVAMRQGSTLSRLLDPEVDPERSATSYYTEGVADARSRYVAASAEDRARQRYWDGDREVLSRRHGGPLYERRFTQSVARHDPAVFRAVLRRTGALDPVEALRENPDVVGWLERDPDTAVPTGRLSWTTVLAAARDRTAEAAI